MWPLTSAPGDQLVYRQLFFYMFDTIYQEHDIIDVELIYVQTGKIQWVTLWAGFLTSSTGNLSSSASSSSAVETTRARLALKPDSFWRVKKKSV